MKVKGGGAMGDPLEDLFSLYQRDVYLYLYSLSRDADLAEELTAETFLEVVRSFHRFRGDADVRTWLFAIARHRWFGHLRKKKQQAPTVLLEEFLASDAPTPESRLMQDAAAERIRELLELEPERTRRIVELRLEGWSFHEIGQEAGVSESSARVIDFRAKAKLRAVLKEEGYFDG